MVSRLVVTPMIRPQRWASMCSMTALAIRNGPLKFTATTRLQADG